MKILTATTLTQGARDNDFCEAVDGELVFFPPIECDCESVDGPCGCRRAMAGLGSHRATTTIQVIERSELDRCSYLELIRDGLKRQGWLPEEVDGDPEVEEWLNEEVDTLLSTAAHFDPGTVLERRGNSVFVRATSSSQS